eukprot:CAMPEP_0119120296 /NCGR_PEP_ID=MMETSP1310-20130426/1392_1 /TAXON_ID=464262 /ORGANISM="Genus nov. species nov., Strain RCC2339" /LENGTH=826 /DNA_ID=CAMNT_0007109765 /DNA_START=33 /DNA_END=2513 /DNA_ORIENTATION=-
MTSTKGSKKTVSNAAEQGASSASAGDGGVSGEKEKEKEGGLAKLFGALGAGAKMQLVMEKKHNEEDDVPEDVLERNQAYLYARKQRKFYSSEKLHIAVLRLVLALLIRKNGTLEENYIVQYPLTEKKINIPFILHQHINHPANSDILLNLIKRVRELGPAEFRLLKLMCVKIFDPKKYKNMIRLAVGAFGVVYSADLPLLQQKVAVKQMDLPKRIHDRCVLHDIFTEITILDRFRDDPRVCRMNDFGVDDGYYWITMKFYKCSLKHWRMKQTKPLSVMLPLYMNIGMSILNVMSWLVENQVNHYDIKCDNYLIEPLVEGISEEDLWNQPTNIPNFSLCIADFGESKIYENELEGYTIRNRGTEYNKSPEMLNVAYASQKTRATYDRRKRVGANIANDMWSLGCALYELFTGEFLFYDNDWIHFFFRVTDRNQELLTEQRKNLLDNNAALIEFFEFVFKRNPDMRPSISEIVLKFRQTMARLVLEGHVKVGPTGPVAQPGGGSKSSAREYDVEIPRIPNTFVDNTVSRIRDYLYFGTEEAAENRANLRNEWDITHIVNTTDGSNAFPWDFIYLQTSLVTSGVSIIKMLDKTNLFQFIDDARNTGGRVFIYSEAAVLIAYLMKAEGLSYGEAYLQCTQARIQVNPHPDFVVELIKWYETSRMEVEHDALHFQCLCGSCKVTLLTPFEAKFVECDCEDGARGSCPGTACGLVVESFQKLYGMDFSTLRWSITTMSNVQALTVNRFAKSCRIGPEPWMRLLALSEVVGESKSKVALTKRWDSRRNLPSSPLSSKEAWDIQQCKGCAYPIFATRGTEDVALLTNIAVTLRN